MIAWEKHVDATRDDPDAIYSRLAAPVAFADGARAGYGFGLGRSREFGRDITGHGGALRGWRSHRLYARADRISVVVMFNHLANAHGAAMELLGAALGEGRAGPDPRAPAPAWLGAYLEPETGLSARIEAGAPGTVRLRFGHAPTPLELRADGSAGEAAGPRLKPDDGGVVLERPGDNASSRLVPLDGAAKADVSGLYRCAELGADLTVAVAGGVLYGGFSGPLGQSRMEMLEPVGGDIWALPCPRALDHTPPGDWTLAFRRGPAGAVDGVTVGCWLARGLTYQRVGPAGM
jgi:D-aminopeptidase